MYMHNFRVTQFLPIDLNKAWSFFSSPGNLSRITPPEMDFKILSRDVSDNIYDGMEIDYRVKPIAGIPVKWKTEIKNVRKLHSFTDIQIRGPYKVWEHTHTFAAVKGGVMMNDEIAYLLPLGILGKIAHFLFVKKKIEKIFNYRKTVLQKMFLNANNTH